jgi:CRISPR type III-B/RAMP module RAMP protein Cmr1
MFECHALTDIWTAGGTLAAVPPGQKDGKPINDRLRLTSLLGGIRWWAEAIVRGFDVRACDPVSEPCRGDQHCIICELFGKADPPQAAKFAVRAWEDTGKRQPFTRKLSKGSTVILEFHFYRDATFLEEYLLVKAMDVISRYGSVGGKTTLKPTRPNTVRMADTGWVDRHTDYGLLHIKGIDKASFQIWATHKDAFENALKEKAINDPNKSMKYPSLKNFWFAPESTLFVHPSAPATDDSINNLLGLADTINANKQLTTKDTWPAPSDVCNPLREHLRGIPEKSILKLPACSKKVFSFGSMGNTKYARTWGYVLNATLLTHLPDLLKSAGITKIAVNGSDVLREPIGG